MKTVLAIGLLCGGTAFAGTGLETTLFPGGHESPGAIHSVANNKLVAIGTYGSTRHGGLARYLSNGALDVSFGGNGKVGTLVGSISTTLTQFDNAQGKIIAIGEFNFGNCIAPIILRYDDDGSLDTSLGGQGFVIPIIGDCNHPNAGYLHDIKIDASNRIVVLGTSSVGHAVIARLSWNGNPDNSFGTQSVFDLTKAVANVGEDATDLAASSLRLTNGNIIAAGSTANGAMIARVTASGALDVSFGFGGVVVSPPYAYGSHDNWTWAKPLTDGSILVVGGSWRTPSVQCPSPEEPSPEQSIMVGHYLVDGTLDTSYGGHGTGRATYQLGYQLTDAGGALDSQGRLVVAASGTNVAVCDAYPTYSDYVAARLTSSGLLDTSFNGVGYTRVSFGIGHSQFDYVSGVTVDANDRPVMLGSPDDSGFGLACLTTGGVLDTSFGP